MCTVDLTLCSTEWSHRFYHHDASFSPSLFATVTILDCLPQSTCCSLKRFHSKLREQAYKYSSKDTKLKLKVAVKSIFCLPAMCMTWLNHLGNSSSKGFTENSFHSRITNQQKSLNWSQSAYKGQGTKAYNSWQHKKATNKILWWFVRVYATNKWWSELGKTVRR